MSTGLTAVNVNANAAFHYAGDKVEHLLGQALQLDAADPKQISIASHVFLHYALQTTSVPPMVLSAVAELHEHLDSSSCKVVSTPVWANIHPDDPHSKNSPLYPLTKGYGQVLPAAEQPRPGPSKGKAQQASSSHHEHQGPQCQQAKSKAIITSDDDMELDNVLAVPEPVLAPMKNNRPTRPLPAPRPIRGVLKTSTVNAMLV
ncbi:hypothetical protein BD769DRAFT_1665185 [Suillus cothurnatus]|nr:hypothetical protein BD769DRAFT_1665185 [Suillus cothurnatus]